MFFNFERHDFLEFFDTEKIFDDEVGSVEYSIKLENGFVFRIFIVAVDFYVSITLNHESFVQPIFNIGFEGIDKIMLEKVSNDTFLKLYKEDQKYHFKDDAEPFLRVMIKPSVSLQLSS